MKNNILKKEYIEAFIGKRELKWYEKAFEKYENNELKFNLIACIFSYLYLIYSDHNYHITQQLLPYNKMFYLE